MGDRPYSDVAPQLRSLDQASRARTRFNANKIRHKRTVLLAIWP